MPVIGDIVSVKGKPERKGILRKFFKIDAVVNGIVTWWPDKNSSQYSSFIEFELLETVLPREQRGRPKKTK
jgi:hypothetical protein